MIERIIENWLDNSSEKTYQIPFCYLLANQGHTIVHLTRHCGMEHGKDIITINPEGQVCVYQLKGSPGSKIKLRQWSDELQGQSMQMIFTPVNHPSASSSSHHVSYLVTNGEMEEEVFTAINSFNKDWEQKGQPQYKLNTIVRGQILKMATDLKDKFVPPGLKDFKHLLEFYLEDGSGTIDKFKLSQLLESILEVPVKSDREKKEAINSAALLVAIATSNFSNKSNHIALIEAWVIYISYLLRFVETNSLGEKHWKNEFQIAYQIVITSLQNLWEEVESSENLLVGNTISDAFIHNSRYTWVVGFLCSLGIIYKINNQNDKDIDSIKKYVTKGQFKLDIWGESGVPSVLCFYWFIKMTDPTELSAKILDKLLSVILSNSKNQEIIFPEPYYGIDECLKFRYQRKEDIQEKLTKWESYYLEGIVHLFTRENYKQRLKALWSEISRIFFKEFNFSDPLDFYLWRATKGKEATKTPNSTQHWEDLKNDSKECNGDILPPLLKANPLILFLFLIVFPQRSNPSVIRWVDSFINKNI